MNRFRRAFCVMSMCWGIMAADDALAFEINSGADANDVIGQADFTTGFSSAGAIFGAQPVSDSRFFGNDDVAYDSANERLFVADTHNHRILIFDLSNGVDGDLSAAFVFRTTRFYNRRNRHWKRIRK